jgi:hypothetical protein
VSRVSSKIVVHSKRACVVYDAKTGHMRHIHRVVTFAGGREPSNDEVAADALQAFDALRSGRDGVFHTLHIDHDAVEPGKKYRVDIHKKALIPRG